MHQPRSVRVFTSATSRRRTASSSATRTATSAAPPRGATIAAWCVFLACAALSQIAFKYAARQTGEFELSVHWFALAATSAWLWVSVASHIGEFLLWMTILSKSALSSAFATTALLFVVIMLASWLLFAEPLTWNKLLGSAVILAGILLLGSDPPHYRPQTAAGGEPGS